MVIYGAGMCKCPKQLKRNMKMLQTLQFIQKGVAVDHIEYFLKSIKDWVAFLGDIR